MARSYQFTFKLAQNSLITTSSHHAPSNRLPLHTNDYLTIHAHALNPLCLRPRRKTSNLYAWKCSELALPQPRNRTSYTFSIPTRAAPKRRRPCSPIHLPPPPPPRRRRRKLMREQSEWCVVLCVLRVLCVL